LWKSHLKLYHLSLAKLKFMMTRGRIPKWIANKDAHFPNMQRQQSYQETMRCKQKIKTDEGSGGCMSLECIESSTASLTAQMKGILTYKRYGVLPQYLSTI